MAPIDRREHRLQRIRGAGTNAVQAKFSFNLGGAPLPPQRSSRRTPQPRASKQSSLPPSSARKTPDTATRRNNGSAKRHRSASASRSSASKPLEQIRELVTPNLGKRKRGSTHAQSADEGDGGLDELSPENDHKTRSIEKSRRVVTTASPILEEVDDEPDELSMFGVDTAMGSIQKTTQTPVALQRTSIAHENGSADVPTIQQEEEGSEDELSPPKTSSTLRSKRAHQPKAPLSPSLEDDLDELSPEQSAVSEVATARQFRQPETVPMATPSMHRVSKTRSKPRRVINDEDEGEEDVLQSTPSTNNPRSITRTIPPLPVDPAEDEDIDELSPESQRAKPVANTKLPPRDIDPAEDENVDELSPEPRIVGRKLPKSSQKEVPEVAYAGEASEDEDDQADPISRSQETRQKAPRKEKRNHNEPPKKRQKRRGPVDVVNVMRLKGLDKGFTIRGVTVADTTRTIAQDVIQNELQAHAQTLESTQHPERRRAIKGVVNTILAFNERFEDRMLDLQDANDSGSRYLSRLKDFKQDNRAMRRDILRMQRDRHEVALEYDEIMDGYNRQKAEYDRTKKLSTCLFNIEAAIWGGKEKARVEGRLDEGPEMPLRMLLDHVSRGVGSMHGGLLSRVSQFNGVLERAAGFLEGRA